MRPALVLAALVTLLWLTPTSLFAQCGSNGAPCLIGTTGDVDLDGDVDAGDWQMLASCLGAPDMPMSGSCPRRDLDSDGDVDLVDLAQFQVTLTGACNCPPNTTPPTARFEVSAIVGVAPLTVHFDAGRTSDVEAVIGAYLWNFADGGTASGPKVTHVFSQPGNYAVTLTAVDAGGLSDITTLDITVSDGTYNINAPVSANEARRFLWQAAFGPDPNSIAFIMQHGYLAWINAQAALPPTTILWDDQEANRLSNYGWSTPQEIWDDICVQGEDQLRQRMAWALIQIVVLNKDQAGSGDRGGGYYYSEYIERALGNYRDLLGFVTLTHQMGNFLTYIGNRKADPNTGTLPDENYARELMQLFTIGLWELNLDGTYFLDDDGHRIPTYGNPQVQQFARVFTGMNWNWQLPEGEDRMIHPMLMWHYDHEFGAKQLLNYPGVAPPDGYVPSIPQGGQNQAAALADVSTALDNVFWHPNVAPFISRQLIQRLVTSNPSPQYVERVATAFEGGGPYGTGARGDLLAVAKAILLDPEARDPAYRVNRAYGRVMEPLVARFGLYRVLGRLDRPTERFPLRVGSNPWNGMDDFGQSLMQSPSVFNFYPPDYIPPGTDMARPALFAPELRILNDVTALGTVENFRWEIVTPDGDAEAAQYDAWRLLAANPPALVSALNQELLFGTMTNEAYQIIVNTVSQIDDPTNRVRTAVWLISGSPEFRVLR